MINSSYPFATSWYGYANNASAAATTFEVYAVCADKPSGYVVVHSAVKTSVPGKSTGADAFCPKGTAETGGGISIASTSTVVDMSGDDPDARAWDAKVGNASSAATTYETWVLCGTHGPKTRHVSPEGTNPAGEQTKVVATCPSGEAVLGGGVDWDLPTSGLPDNVGVNSTYPGTGTWISYENNGSTTNADLVGYVLCAT
jgi:hypothetical protein